MAQAKAIKKTPVAFPSRDRAVAFKDKLKDSQIVLMLQGGGALGAYQVGAFEALANECKKVNRKIDWVAGISIGAINAAVIAAPMSGDPAVELQLLWNEILSPKYPPFDYTELMKLWLSWPWRGCLRDLDSKYAGWSWMAFNPLGQANFFSSRVLNPFENPWVQQWFRKLGRNELAFYGTSGTGSLADTLSNRVNWKALNNPDSTRLSLGAAHVCDGEVRFFDSRNPRDAPLNELHVLASAALPPAFPPIQIGDEWFFDGGVSNNTPIEVLAGQLFESRKDTLVFLIDLWDRKNDVLPESFDDVLWRQKCIQFGSRKNAAEIVVERYNYLAKSGKLKKPVRMDFCQLMLEHKDHEPQFCFADADFSRETFERLRAQGTEDMTGALQHAEKVTNNERDLFKDTDLLKQADLLQGPKASLYRFGSQGKWKAPRNGHRHQASNRSDLPPALESWMQMWK